MDLGLTGRACIVSGASSGIGAATTRALCAEGARVLLVGRRPEPLQEVAEKAQAGGGRAETLPLDVTGPHPQRELTAAVARASGGSDGVRLAGKGLVPGVIYGAGKDAVAIQPLDKPTGATTE